MSYNHIIIFNEHGLGTTLSSMHFHIKFETLFCVSNEITNFASQRLTNQPTLKIMAMYELKLELLSS